MAVGDQAGNGSAFGRDGAEAPGGGLGRPEGQADGNGAGHPEVPQARPASRRALKNWRVRSRLLLLITIPTLTAVALGGIRIASSVQSALAYQRVLQLTTLSSDITVLAQRLEDERDQTVYYIALGSDGGRASSPTNKAVALGVVAGYQHQTNEAVAQVRAQLEEVGGSFPAQTQQEATTALSELNALSDLRNAATRTHLPALDVSRKYTGLIDDLLVLEDATGQGASDATLAQSVRVLGLVSHMKEDASEQRAILTAALIQHTLTNEALHDLTNAQSDQSANLGEFNLTATASQRQLWNSTGTGPIAYLAPNEEQQAINLQTNSGSLAGDQTHADDWYGAESHIINFQMGAVERSLVHQITARASSLRNEAVTAAIITGVVILFVLALALFFTVVVARSMVRPLRRLRAGALEVAGIRLPETVRRISEGEGDGAPSPLDVAPIEVDSTDEIGEVARAFDQVHREAVRLASNEAALRGNVNAMFV
ncbi:MAG TPA: nitrate- and nitrite sensing domain-containing protein, partial [Streptosporangiaceae bacterium]|nr:nitrate- and nitrite sensing domain-containing protein [Streptosporangiaceae bacterium]